MFLTASRAGVVLSLFAMIVTFTLHFRHALPAKSGVWIAMASGILVSLALLEFLGGTVSSRFDIRGLDDEGRIEAYRSALRIIADHPWFGTGLGTFAWSFPAYRSPDISMAGIWDIAHSTPLELAAEVGLPLCGAVCVGWGAMLAILVRGIVRRRDSVIPLSALAVSMVALLHSLIDFSLQIPGYAIMVFALMGTGVARSLSGHPLRV
jgi:O-antigen ligase